MIMIAEYKNKSYLGIVGGVFLQLLGIYLMAKFGFLGYVSGRLLGLAGAGLLIYGCVMYAKGKGQSGFAGLLGLLSLVGLIFLFFLPDKNKTRGNKEFWHIDPILFIFVVLGILATIVVFSIYRFMIQSDKQNLQRKSDISMISEALDSYYSQYNQYPQSLDGLVQFGFLKTLPNDPDGQEYDYEVKHSGRVSLYAELESIKDSFGMPPRPQKWCWRSYYNTAELPHNGICE